MKLLHLFKGRLQNIENMKMYKSPPIASVTTVKEEWLKLWHDIKDLVKVLFRIILIKKVLKIAKVLKVKKSSKHRRMLNFTARCGSYALMYFMASLTFNLLCKATGEFYMKILLTFLNLELKSLSLSVLNFSIFDV